MIIFRFDNRDISEDLQKDYQSFEIRYEDGTRLNLDEIMERIWVFLDAFGYKTDRERLLKRCPFCGEDTNEEEMDKKE